jgi:hypothetical protein
MLTPLVELKKNESQCCALDLQNSTYRTFRQRDKKMLLKIKYDDLVVK